MRNSLPDKLVKGLLQVVYSKSGQYGREPGIK